MQSVQERQIPANDDQPGLVEPIPATVDQRARPQPPTLVEADESKFRAFISAITRLARSARETFYKRILDPVLGGVFVIGLLVWKHLLSRSFSAKAKKRRDA